MNERASSIDPKCAAKRTHHECRRRGVCIASPTHGKAFRGGRCRKCWLRKLARERAAYAAERKI